MSNWVANFHRGRRLRLVLLHNPHDRKARADLGEILISQRRYRRAIQIVKYQRRRDRIWAWRARPSRPLIYAAAACCGIALVGTALQRSTPSAHAAADVRSSPTPGTSAPPAR